MQPQTIQVRNIHFELDGEADEIPKAWHGAGLGVSRFFDALSLLFPAGERFFIAAVKHYAPRVTEPELQEQVKLFSAQEGVHSREHIVYNRMLDRFGYRGTLLDQRMTRYFRWLTPLLHPRHRLAITCALEHFTAVLAHLLLLNTGVLAEAHPRMAALWRWHAAEENEHKAVAFDVYRATGGSYWIRCGVMLTTTFFFIYNLLLYRFLLVPGDSFRTTWKQVRETVRFLSKHGSWLELLRMYLAYYRPSFHPCDFDSAELLRSWRADFADSPYA